MESFKLFFYYKMVLHILRRWREDSIQRRRKVIVNRARLCTVHTQNTLAILLICNCLERMKWNAINFQRSHLCCHPSSTDDGQSRLYTWTERHILWSTWPFQISAGCFLRDGKWQIKSKKKKVFSAESQARAVGDWISRHTWGEGGAKRNKYI